MLVNLAEAAPLFAHEVHQLFHHVPLRNSDISTILDIKLHHSVLSVFAGAILKTIYAITV